jgi:hypothetical protein
MASTKFGPVYTRIHDLVSIPEFGELVEGLGYDSL